MAAGDAIGVIFDLDGVLIDSEGLQYASYGRVLERYGVRVSPEVYGREFIGTGRGAEWAVREFNLPVSPEEIRSQKKPIYEAMLRDEVTLMPGVCECLARLGSRFSLTVATNSVRADVDFVLDRFDIRRHFATVVPREAYDKPKPAPDAFLAAAKSLGRSTADCVVIEDAFKGVKAAHAAEIACIAVPHDLTRNNDFSLATRVVDGLDQVTVELVEEVVRRR